MPKAPSSKRKHRPRDDEEDEEKRPIDWKAWARDILVAVLIIVVLLGAIYAYTGVWPPLVVVESSSMQHGDTTSYIGVIDTGDLVFVQAAPARADVITYLQGRVSGYQTYGDYGDVIIFHTSNPGATPIIHRAILYIRPNGTDAADVRDLAALPTSQWEGYGPTGLPTHSPYDLSAVTIHGMGYEHNLGITFDLAYFAQDFGHAGYITMGDNNAYAACLQHDPCGPNTRPYDTGWLPSQGDIIGHARGELPWFGLLKLLVSPAPGGCCHGWGDPLAPANSWTDLALSLVVLAALPFLVEIAAWGWTTYAWPWLGPRLGFKPKEEQKKLRPPPEEEPGNPPDEEDGPRGGSSGP